MAEREKIIVKTSIIGIIANVILAAFKAAVGAISGSIAIVLDAVNNLSDALSSVITIVGTKLAGKAPDRKHPLGHGRIEYLTATIIAVIVLYAGITSLVESIKKIISPEAADYSKTTLIIVAVAIIVKILLGRYVKGVGEKIHSDSLIASGTDATMDAAISAATLVAALIFIFGGVSLEAYLGAIISVIIIKSGVDMLRDTLSKIIGERVESDLSKEIKKTICEEKDVYGAYDLILHSYGPDTLMGSVHVEIPDYYTADRIDEVTRSIQKRVYDNYGVILTGVGIYSRNTKDDEAARIRTQVTEKVMAHQGVLQLHGFYLDEKSRTITFDVILDFKEDREALYKEIHREVCEMLPEYKIYITMDSDISD